MIADPVLRAITATPPSGWNFDGQGHPFTSITFSTLDATANQLDPALDAIISTSEPIQDLASGFGGELGPAEGPVWWKEGGYLLFSDIHNNRRMKYTPGQRGAAVDLEPSNRANGLTRDPKGRLIACEHDTRRVTRRVAGLTVSIVDP